MATGLVKWWRARFLAGYKPFSVVGGNTEGSDSEELLAGVTTSCNASPPPPSTQPILVESPQVPANGAANSEQVSNDQPNPTTTKQLSFEEFECDVSVADGDRRRQEFSFTLYDFDGHGKITKDDIAGLVTTIYDTLGASIQVPPCGSKTIKVKLTVSPDQRTGQTHATCLNSSQCPTSLNSSENAACCHLKHTAPCGHVTTHPTHGSRRIPRRRKPARHRRCQPEQKEAETHSEDDAENTQANNVKQEEVRRRVGLVPHLPSPYSNSSEGDVSDDSDTSPTYSPLTPLLTPNQRKRSGALQRQQLLEIIQANMEKNNLSFHTSRKRHQNEKLRISSQSPQVDPPVSYSQGCRPLSEPRQPTTTYHKPVRENSHSVSFPKLPAKTRGGLRKTRMSHGIHRNTAVQSPRTQTQPHILTRNITNPLANNEQHITSNTNHNIANLVTNSNNNQQTNNQNSNTNYNNAQRCENQYIQSQQCSKGSKKHQLKHATREQDQARAMAQVVRWLEREFSQNAAATAASRRHVHEHIHHHYHHYHAEALV